MFWSAAEMSQLKADSIWAVDAMPREPRQYAWCCQSWRFLRHSNKLVHRKETDRVRNTTATSPCPEPRSCHSLSLRHILILSSQLYLFLVSFLPVFPPKPIFFSLIRATCPASPIIPDWSLASINPKFIQTSKQSLARYFVHRACHVALWNSSVCDVLDSIEKELLSACFSSACVSNY